VPVCRSIAPRNDAARVADKGAPPTGSKSFSGHSALRARKIPVLRFIKGYATYGAREFDDAALLRHISKLIAIEINREGALKDYRDFKTMGIAIMKFAKGQDVGL
jgi:hypothetical protein